MKIELETKPRPIGLYSICLNRLEELQESYNQGVIPFSEVFQKICSNFSITKLQCWDILFLIRDAGFIDIVKFRGIKII